MSTRKMTIKYWNSLSKGSKERALHHVFPALKVTVEMLLIHCMADRLEQSKDSKRFLLQDGS